MAHLKIFLWIAGVIVLVELGLEIRANQRGWDTMIFGFPAAAQSASSQGTDTIEFGPTSTFPFRSRIIPKERSSGNHRYWVASSSHAEDIYLPPTMIFPSILDRLLREGGVNAAVLNASRAGNDIPGNVDDLRRWGSEWRPDYVILYQMSLTIGSLAKHIFSKKRSQIASSAKGSNPVGKPFSWANRLVEKTTVYANVKGQLTARIGETRVLANDLGLQGEQAFAAELRDFIGAARAIGSVPVLTTFATSHTRKQLADFPQEIALGLFKYSSVLSVEGWVASVERLNMAVKRVATDEGIMLIDIESAVGSHPESFRDFVHFTPAGHDAVARTMRDALIQLERRESVLSAVQRGTVQ